MVSATQEGQRRKSAGVAPALAALVLFGAFSSVLEVAWAPLGARVVLAPLRAAAGDEAKVDADAVAEKQKAVVEAGAAKQEDPAWGDVGYYDEERNIQTLGIDPATLGALALLAVCVNFFILANL
mmetsp:Transcript_53968/g.125497  ORF Transcript_53968/g.125497 Transcript_53968/m.125497 type:complete len:125 (-) Transcript_53968:109-483(-)